MEESLLTVSLLTSVGYLEKQRKWPDSSAVRDLEFEGDTILKELAKKFEIHRAHQRKQSRISGANVRNVLADEMVGNLWKACSHWMMAKHTDPIGRRILLVPNRCK
jgi:hypothetical protein